MHGTEDKIREAASFCEDAVEYMLEIKLLHVEFSNRVSCHGLHQETAHECCIPVLLRRVSPL